MQKKYTIAIILVAVLLLLAFAVFRGQGSRELILKRDGLPLANLRAEILPHDCEPTVSATSTDENGRLDLGAVPEGTEMIAITLRDGTTSVYNGDIVLPARGSRTIDFRGNRTICTTTVTYADFGLFQITRQEVQETVQHDKTVAPLKAEAEEPKKSAEEPKKPAVKESPDSP